MTKKTLLLSILVGLALVGCQKDVDTSTTAPAPPGGPKKTAVPGEAGTKSKMGGMSKAGMKLGGGDSHIGENAKNGG